MERQKKNNKEDKKNQEEANQLAKLEQFVLKSNCLNDLKKWTQNINIFEIIKTATYETRHSSILAWLLDSNENHGLGDTFVREFVKRVIVKNSDKQYALLNWMFLDFYNGEVETEWSGTDETKSKKGNKYLDILVTFEGQNDKKYIIAIENKTTSQEHMSGKDYQTAIYSKRLGDNFKDCEIMQVFLTPDGDEPYDSSWGVLTYDDVLEVLDAVMIDEQKNRVLNISDRVIMIIDNYKELIKKYLVDDEELTKRCEDIYREHGETLDIIYKCIKGKRGVDKISKQVVDTCNKINSRNEKELDLIYENKVDDVAKLADELRELLKTKQNEGVVKQINGSGKNYIHFTLTQLDETIIPQNKNADSSWKTHETYSFFFETKYIKTEDKINFIFELGGSNIDDDTRTNHQEISDIKFEGVNTKARWRESYKFMRVAVKPMACNLSHGVTDNLVKKIFNDAMECVKKWSNQVIEMRKNTK